MGAASSLRRARNLVGQLGRSQIGGLTQRAVIRTRSSGQNTVVGGGLAVYLGYLGSTSTTLGSQLGGWMAAAVAAALCFRSWFAGVIFTRDGVSMRGFVRTRSAPWSQVNGFSTHQQWAGHTVRNIVIELTDGRRWQTPAIFCQRRDADEVVRRMQTARVDVTRNRSS
jgi:hypothetical protein